MRDVMVIGGGVVGLWCAFHLHQQGLTVTIIDKGEMTDGSSYGNAGMIVPSHFVPMASPGVISQGIKWMFKKDSPFYIKPRLNLELAHWLWQFYRSSTKKHVEESMALLCDMHMESRALYKRLNEKSEFDFGFEQKGILMLYKSSAAEKDEIKTAEVAHQLGLEAKQLSPEALKNVEPGIDFSVEGAIHYPGDAHINPALFMQQMISFLKTSGVEILTNHEAVHVDDQAKQGCTVTFANGNKLSARYGVMTSGIWSSYIMKKSGYRLPMQDGKGYSMNFSKLGNTPTIPSILHEARVAITPMGEELRVAGTLEISGMRNSISAEKVNSILGAVPKYYPKLKLNAKVPVWSGFRPCTPDGLPYIGRWRADSSLIVATGHAMMGLSLAPVSGRMVANEILENNSKSVHSKLLPGRF